MRTIRNFALYLFAGLACVTAGAATNQTAVLEPGFYKLQFFFSPKTDESEMSRAFGDRFDDFKDRVIMSAAMTLQAEDAVKWRPILEKAQSNDLHSFLALPLNWWRDFPVDLSSNHNVIELPSPTFRRPIMFDGKVFKASGNLSPTIVVDLLGAVKDTKNVTGTFTVQWYDMKTRATQKSNIGGSFIIQRTGPLSKDGIQMNASQPASAP